MVSFADRRIQTLGCSFALSVTSQSVASAAASGSVTVTVGTGCTWSAVSQVPCILVPAGNFGSANAAVQFAVAPNTTGSSRPGILLVAGQTFTVTQAAN